MRNLPWASPEALSRMTIAQFYCLASPRPPGPPSRVKSLEEYEAAMETKRAADAAWNGRT